MSNAVQDDDPLRKWARKRVVHVRTLKLRVALFAFTMLVLAPVWIVSEYLRSGGWPQRISPNDNPGDWSPWLIWVAVAWALWIGLTAVTLHFRRPPSEHEIARELRRLAPRS